VLPIVLPSQPISASEETNRDSNLGEIKERLTQPSDPTDTETFEATTHIPTSNRYVHHQSHKRSPVTTDRDDEYGIIDPNGSYAPDHILPNMDDNRHSKPDMFHKTAYQNHMVTDSSETNVFRKNYNSNAHLHVTGSEEKFGSDQPAVAHDITYEMQFVTENVLRKSDRTEQNAYPGSTESDAQGINNAKKPEESGNIAYRNHIIIGNSEEDVFRKMDRSEQNAYPEITESDAQGINNAKKPDKSGNIAYRNHIITDDSEEDVFRTMDRIEQNVYPEITESDAQGINSDRKPDKSGDIAHQVNIITGDIEEDVFRTMDRSEQNAYSDHMEANGITTPYRDKTPDYDEIIDSEDNTGYELEDEDTRNPLHQDEREMVCTDEMTCSVARESAENVSEKAERGELDKTTDPLIGESVKILKNSFTIKFPTFERIVNKLSEWLRFIFGTKPSDEGKITLLNEKLSP
jgi:hypothetical protein